MDQQYVRTYVRTHTPCKTYRILQQSVMRNSLENCDFECKSPQKVALLMLCLGSSCSASTGMRYSKESHSVTKPWPAKYTNASTPVASLPAAAKGGRVEREGSGRGSRKRRGKGRGRGRVEDKGTGQEVKGNDKQKI